MALIGEFLDLYPKRNTRLAYQGGIRLFFDLMYKHKRVNDDSVYETFAERYLNELENGERSFSADMLKFAASLEDKPPLTARVRIAAVKELFAHNGIDLNHRENKNVRRRVPKGYAVTQEEELTREKIREILNYCDLKSRALFLLMVSSGLRVGEANSITLNDIDLEKNPAEIRIRQRITKTGEPRTTFMSAEAANVVRAWLAVRREYLISAQNRNAGLIDRGLSKEKSTEDDRVFPWKNSTTKRLWDNALRKSGMHSIDENTGRLQLHPHMLRKFFRTNAATRCPVDVIEALMGHTGYLTQAYRRYSGRQLAEYYLKAEPALTIAIADDPEVKERLGTLARENEQLRKDLEALKAQSREQSATMELIELVLDQPGGSDLLHEAMVRKRAKTTYPGSQSE